MTKSQTEGKKDYLLNRRTIIRTNKEIARDIVRFIIADLMDRSGLDGAWDSIDGYIQNEIIKKWNEIAIKQLEKQLTVNITNTFNESNEKHV